MAAVGADLIAAGRAQAAADIRAHLGPDPSPASPVWWAGYTEALSDCARVAEGGGVKAVPCCDSHNTNCEWPSELCCHDCTEATHRGLFPHADGSACVLDAPSTAEGGGEADPPKERT